MQNVKILVGDALERLKELPDESVHCVVTSPPYWGLRDYGTEGQLGLEATPEEHCLAMVDVFREVRRVMRYDATLWLNYGDSYASNPASGGAGQQEGGEHQETPRRSYTRPLGLKPKDLVGMPWRMAFALQHDGWYLRSDIIWHKPNPMPESVTDRPTKSHEHMFLLAKSKKYYYDADAVREVAEYGFSKTTRGKGNISIGGNRGSRTVTPGDGGKRNLRDVWKIATHSFKGAHFATFPPKLVEPCIKAGTSEEGCCGVCGAPRVRQVEPNTGGSTGRAWLDHAHDAEKGGFKTVSSTGYRRGSTSGWAASCSCDAPKTPCVVLDPFGGAGTVGLVANRLGRNAVLIELNGEYAEMARKRISDDCPMLVNVELK